MKPPRDDQAGPSPTNRRRSGNRLDEETSANGIVPCAGRTVSADNTDSRYHGLLKIYRRPENKPHQLINWKQTWQTISRWVCHTFNLQVIWNYRQELLGKCVRPSLSNELGCLKSRAGR